VVVSPHAGEEDFIRRQRRDAAAIPLRVWLAALDQGLFDGDLQRIDADLQRTLPRLEAPTLLIWGSADPSCGGGGAPEPARGAAALRRLRSSRGWAQPFWEDPQHCADVINAFLTAAPSGAARSGRPACRR